MSPKGYGEPVLYLDYDGVLMHDNVLWHPKRGAYLRAPEGHTLFQHAPLLEELLTPHPAIRIVLSTSWVLRYRCAGAAKRLPAGLRARVIGATYHSEMWKDAFQALPRWKQIWNDVLRRRPGSWLAVDNDVADWPADLRQHLVATDDAHGISLPSVLDELRRQLQLLAALQLSVDVSEQASAPASTGEVDIAERLGASEEDQGEFTPGRVQRVSRPPKLDD